MRHSVLLPALILSYPLTLAAQSPGPLRLCVAMLENRSHSTVTPEWQQRELIRALERTNKTKDVKKGAAQLTVSALQSTDADANVGKEGCGFVLYTELVDVEAADNPRIGTSLPGAVGTGVTIGKVDQPPDMRRQLHDATVNYRIMRDGDPNSWASGIVTAKDTVTEEALVSRLMDQVASRAAHELRNPHPSTPE